MKTEEVKCKQCESLVVKTTTEIKRIAREKRHVFCDRACAYEYHLINPKMISAEHKEINKVNDDLKHDNLPIESKMRWYVKLCKKHQNDTNRLVTITAEDLLDLWNKQKGLCAYSKIPLKLKSCYSSGKDVIYSASIDRIDSSKAYSKDNVQFVSMGINFMKNTMTHEDCILMCQLIASLA